MPQEFHTTRRIEFSDTDMAGIVHFARFFVFMEGAEHAFLRSLGTSVSAELEGNKIGWPRLEASCEFVHPVKSEDELAIRVVVAKMGTKSMTYDFEFTMSGEPIATGRLKTVCCICNPGEPIRSIPIPAFIADQIQDVEDH